MPPLSLSEGWCTSQRKPPKKNQHLIASSFILAMTNLQKTEQRRDIWLLLHDCHTEPGEHLSNLQYVLLVVCARNGQEMIQGAQHDFRLLLGRQGKGHRSARMNQIKNSEQTEKHF
jgi:hypothetical protein